MLRPTIYIPSRLYRLLAAGGGTDAATTPDPREPGSSGPAVRPRPREVAEPGEAVLTS